MCKTNCSVQRVSGNPKNFCVQEVCTLETKTAIEGRRLPFCCMVFRTHAGLVYSPSRPFPPGGRLNALEYASTGVTTSSRWIIEIELCSILQIVLLQCSHGAIIARHSASALERTQRLVSAETGTRVATVLRARIRASLG